MTDPQPPGARTISVVIPALNEEEGIGGVIDQIPSKELASRGFAVEIVVVDGESTDRTREVARSRGARVIVEPRRGYGRAYKTGFERARGEILVTADADLTYPVEQIPALVDELERESLDFLTTDRFARMREGAMSRKHRIGNWVLSTAMRVLFLTRVRDSQSGMWVLRRSALPRLSLTSDGMAYSEEIKIEAFSKLRAREVPIEYRSRVGEVKLNSWKDGLRNLGFLFRKRFGLTRPE
ncbi:MAG TPA: glycosyltransferase family 2 protein [Candidatus Thermoplasmatota archaeon]|nr:glycosyltransferase family 2 protein [Candidatus Thermoplasmatota archaeon]